MVILEFGLYDFEDEDQCMIYLVVFFWEIGVEFYCVVLDVYISFFFLWEFREIFLEEEEESNDDYLLIVGYLIFYKDEWDESSLVDLFNSWVKQCKDGIYRVIKKYWNCVF